MRVLVQSDIHMGEPKSLGGAYKSLYSTPKGLIKFGDFLIRHGQSEHNAVLGAAIRQVAPIVFGPQPFDPFDL